VTKKYRDDMDSLRLFLDEECYCDAKQKIARKHLHAAYEEWCQEARMTPLRRSAIIAAMEAKGFTEKRIQGIDYYSGIGFLPIAGY
jgi:phage/plasmid-associated DNA primase